MVESAIFLLFICVFRTRAIPRRLKWVHDLFTGEFSTASGSRKGCFNRLLGAWVAHFDSGDILLVYVQSKIVINLIVQVCSRIRHLLDLDNWHVITPGSLFWYLLKLLALLSLADSLFDGRCAVCAEFKSWDAGHASSKKLGTVLLCNEWGRLRLFLFLRISRPTWCLTTRWLFLQIGLLPLAIAECLGFAPFQTQWFRLFLLLALHLVEICALGGVLSRLVWVFSRENNIVTSRLCLH